MDRKTSLEDWKIIEELRIADDPRLPRIREPMPWDSGAFFSRIATSPGSYVSRNLRRLPARRVS